ncbi:serine/threonine-protein kinase [Acidimangrovimonas pyrenivorans]|uniref:Serine/threonine-protein kinase n=1 Tax=Acidimangrovimonas pyrenivorans TaxID=2030798 RepID=A0ABV7AF60_9RHOB
MKAALDMDGVSSAEEFTDELKPGTRLLHGQYTIERFLKVGGFGLTYLARDSLDRTVVIKECFPGTMCSRSDREVRARSRVHQDEFNSVVRLFVQEARRLAKVRHPNIVGVHQVFEDNGTAYMALDYVEGDDLLDIVEEAPQLLGPAEISEMLQKLLRAIGFVHDHGLLHRDIAPDNILLGPTDEPVLIDFGAAREQATKASRVLSALQVVKDGYSPQEFYISNGPQAPASDLYSLAATFYHLIAGHAPVNSQMRLAVVAAQEPDPYQPLAGRFPDYDKDLLASIDRAMALFPKQRPQTAQEWLALIDARQRREAAQARVRNDARIDESISQLVQEVNRAVEDATEADKRKKRDMARVPAKPEKKVYFAWQLEGDGSLYNFEEGAEAPASGKGQWRQVPGAASQPVQRPRRLGLLGFFFGRGLKPRLRD